MGVSCTDTYIGSAAVIKVDFTTHIGVPSSSFYWRMEWTFGDLSGYENFGFKESEHSWLIPTDFYSQIPDATQGKCECVIYPCDFISGQALASSIAFSFIAKAVPSYCQPTINLPTVVDTNAAAVALTGDSSQIIRHISTARLRATATAKNSAILEECYITNGEKELFNYNGIVDVLFSNVGSTAFRLQAKDSRGYTTSITYTIPAERIVEYIKLTCNAGGERPDTSGEMRLTCSGNYYNGSFGKESNTLKVEYRYKESGGEFGAWAVMMANISGNSYTAYKDLDGLDYKKTYVFECRATDSAMTAYSAEAKARALPVFHWGENDFVHETPVDFRAGIMANGNESDIIVEQGTDGIWTYRKWHSGLAECWGTYSTNIYGSDWSAWGSLYQATILQLHEYPFTFAEVPREIATLHSLSGGLLNASAMGLSQSTTGSYFAVHPNQLSNTYSFLLTLYVCGRWK